MKHIDAICDVWQGNVCKKYIIVVIIMNYWSFCISFYKIQNINFVAQILLQKYSNIEAI
jgi:hypothetical protein